jgi:FAD/FMN-containing dehydrogenase
MMDTLPSDGTDDQSRPPPHQNWSGSLAFRPARFVEPADEEALSALVRRAAREERSVRPVGSAHSSTPIIATDDTLVSLGNLRRLEDWDGARCQATVGSGAKLIDIGKELAGVGLTFPNYGDVASQTVAGVIATGTHGSGRELHNLSMMMIGGRLVTSAGEIREFSFEHDPDFVRALRVSLGALGILSAVRLQLVPLFDLHRQEWCLGTDDCMERLEAMSLENRNIDFYWYPRSDVVKLRCLNRPGNAPDYSGFARLVEDLTGPAHEVIAKHTGISQRFEEMEYALPIEAGPACFAEVRRRMKGKWRRIVGWRVLYRFIKADDSWLSEAFGRDTVAISLHQNASLPFQRFFADLEPIFRNYGGRPHWAKKHSLVSEDLRPLYPMWDRFAALRRSMDPERVFGTPYLDSLLGS